MDGLIPDDDASMWGFPNHHTFYFSFSIISTIGYGSIVPASTAGKMFTVRCFLRRSKQSMIAFFALSNT